MQPIITPWELLLALEGPKMSWNPSKWTLDITTVLEGEPSASGGLEL